MKPLVSIIIVVKNDPGVARTLELIRAQQIQAGVETIVVDASTPERLAAARERSPWARWEQFDQGGKRFTIPEQRNFGLSLAQGGIVVFIDANCEPEPDWLAALVGAIQDGEDVVCGPCRPSNASNLVHYIEEHSERTYVPECTTINVAVRRAVFAKIGQFDEQLSYGEDVDFFWRAVDAGYRICFEPKAAIAHDYGATGEQVRRAYRYGKARVALHQKHWRKRWWQLVRNEPHVWMYPAFMLGLPLAVWWPWYLLAVAVPVAKNRSLKVTAHHFIYGWGVLAGLILRRRV